MPSVRHLATIGSTNDALMDWAAAGAAEGDWIRADVQTGGRGRSGRGWVSPAGNLHASGLVRLSPSDPPAASLALVVAVAVREVIAALLPDDHAPLIKWPNDILVGGAKVAGILLERRDTAVVCGIGINLAHAPPGLERAVASIAGLGGASVDPGEMLAVLAMATARWVARWRGEGLVAVRQAWLRGAHPIGSALAARIGNATVEGSFEGLDPDGALLLREADGTKHVVRAGDVFLL